MVWESKADDLISNDSGYMQGHPSYNASYYDYNYNNRVNSPNYNSDYYDNMKSSSVDSGYENNSPSGSDIRDYNPYYDRNGNLK